MNSGSSVYDFSETSHEKEFDAFLLVFLPTEINLEEIVKDYMNNNKEETSANKSYCKSSTTEKSDGKTLFLSTTDYGKNRKWDKNYYCPLCEKLFSKLTRHMESTHTKEPEKTSLLAIKIDGKNKKIREHILCKQKILTIINTIVKEKEKAACF